MVDVGITITIVIEIESVQTLNWKFNDVKILYYISSLCIRDN